MTKQKARAYLYSRRNSPNFWAILQEIKPGIKTKRDMRRYLENNKKDAISRLMTNFPEILENMRKHRESIQNRFLRVACFTSADVKLLDEILMWSHYAASHEGSRIGFEFPAGITYPFKISQVVYQSHRVQIDFSVNMFDSPENQQALELSLKTKSTAWTYEQEYRLITHPDHTEKEASRDFVPLNTSWVKRVDFGTRYPEKDREEFVALLRSDYPHVEAYQAHYHQSDYRLEYHKL